MKRIQVSISNEPPIFKAPADVIEHATPRDPKTTSTPGVATGDRPTGEQSSGERSSKDRPNRPTVQ